jgi:hypothetical protein
LPVIEDKHLVGAGNGRRPVGDHERRPALEER